MKASELFRKYLKTSDFDHSNYRLFERIPAVSGTSNNRGLTVGVLYTGRNFKQNVWKKFKRNFGPYSWPVQIRIQIVGARIYQTIFSKVLKLSD